MKSVIIHTDGSCLGNPGPGGWAVLLRAPATGHFRELSGGFRLTTNNRMEIFAAIMGLAALKEPCSVDLHTDSQYLRNAVEKGWLAAWRRNGWRKADKKPVLNVDLWLRLESLLKTHSVRLRWVRGHAGEPDNERCDEMARQRAQEEGLPPDLEFEALRK